MLTANDFRRLASSLPGAIESAHMGHPDFRAHGRIFATLLPGGEWGMVKLTPEQQDTFVCKDPETFEVGQGAWGRQGCTLVRLDAAKAATVREALELALANNAAKAAAKRPARTRTPKSPRSKRRG
jgi:hypothetical protein